jgi:hypothetical protein
MTAPVDKKGPRRNDDPRLRAQRHDGVVCDPEGVTRTRSSSASPKPVETEVRKIIHANSTTTPPTSIPRSRVAARLRLSLHATSAWLNAAEGLFAKLTRRRLERSFIAKTAAP